MGMQVQQPREWRPGGPGAVEADLIDVLFSQSARARYHPQLVFLAVAPFFLAHAPWWTLAVIMGLQAAGTGLGDVLRRRYRHLPREADRRPWARRYLVVTGLCAASWGAAGLLWFVPGNVPLQALLAVIVAGAVSGSLVPRAPYPPALFLFIAMSGAPLVFSLALSGHAVSQVMAALALVYGSGLIGWGQGVYKAQRTAIEARHRNDRLLAELAQARAQAEARAAEAEAARRAAEAGERAKAAFLAMMSHELRTPLNGIQGMAGVLAETPLEDRQREYLAVIRESAEGLHTLLEDILELSRLENGDLALAQAPFAPAAICREALRIAAPEARKKQLSLDCDIQPGVPGQVLGDARRVRQALVNLCGNAVKFTEAGSVRLEVSVVPADAPAWLRFAVHDTGPGIAPGRLDELFEPFTQADQTATRRHGGSGLGLALARRLVTAMGGTLKARSTPGEGSSFWFDVPLRLPAGQELHPAPQEAVPSSGGASAGRDAAGSEESGRAFDPAPLTALEASLGRDKALELVQIYLDTAQALGADAMAATAAGDGEALKRAAHDLKSTAATLGLTALCECAAGIERNLREERPEPAFAAAQDVPGHLEAARAALTARYPEVAA